VWMVVVGIVSVVVGLVTWLYAKHLRLVNSYPNDANAQFIFGHYFNLFGKEAQDHRGLDWITELCSKNGWFYVRLPLAELIPSMNFVVITDPKDVEYVLSTKFDNYIKGSEFTDTLYDLLGDGIFNVNGESWQVQRKAASHEFSVAQFRDFMTHKFIKTSKDLGDHIETLCAESEKSGTAEGVDLQKLFHKFTLQSIGEIAFGVNLGCLTKDVPFEVAFDRATELSSKRFAAPLWKISRSLNRLNIGLRHVYQGVANEAELNDSIHVMREFSRAVIEERRKLSQQELDERTDLLSRFMVLKDKNGSVYSDDFLHSIVVNFILAGRDTTACCLSWLFYNLSHNPRVEALVLEEIEETLGSILDKTEPTFDALRSTNMPYLHATIVETLRLHPSVPADIKECINEDVLPSGIKVGAGWNVDYHPYAMGRQVKNWGKDAAEFKPERFLSKIDDDGGANSNTKWQFHKPSPFKFTAFQAGKRLCLGMDMAYLETKIAAIELLQRHRISMSKGFEEATYARTITLPMKVCRTDITSKCINA